jgi:hypothetical protein
MYVDIIETPVIQTPVPTRGAAAALTNSVTNVGEMSLPVSLGTLAFDESKLFTATLTVSDLTDDADDCAARTRAPVATLPAEFASTTCAKPLLLVTDVTATLAIATAAAAAMSLRSAVTAAVDVSAVAATVASIGMSHPTLNEKRADATGLPACVVGLPSLWSARSTATLGVVARSPAARRTSRSWLSEGASRMLTPVAITIWMH